MDPFEVGIEIEANVKGNAEGKINDIAASLERVMAKAESTAYKSKVNPYMPGRISSKPTNIRDWQYDESGKVVGWTQGKRKKADSGGRRRGRRKDPEKELDKLHREAVSIMTKASIFESQILRARHADKQREIREENRNVRNALKLAEQSERQTMRFKTREENRILQKQQRMGRQFGRLMGRAFWDIIQGRQGTFEALFKRGAQFAVTIIGEKVGEIFVRVGENTLAKYIQGSELIKKAGSFLEKGLQKGADYLIDGLMKVAKQLFKMLEKIPGVGPFIGMVGSFFKHQGGMIAHQGAMVAHNGMKMDERLILARVGEMIINPDATRALHQKNPQAFQYLNKGQLPPSGGHTSVTMEVRSTSNIEIDRYVRTKLSAILHRSRTPFIKQ